MERQREERRCSLTAVQVVWPSLTTFGALQSKHSPLGLYVVPSQSAHTQSELSDPPTGPVPGAHCVTQEVQQTRLECCSQCAPAGFNTHRGTDRAVRVHDCANRARLRLREQSKSKEQN